MKDKKVIEKKFRLREKIYEYYKKQVDDFFIITSEFQGRELYVERGTKEEMQFMPMEGVHLESVIFEYNNCYNDSFDLQIVCNATDYSVSDKNTNIGIDINTGMLIPVNGGMVQIEKLRPVESLDGDGWWIYQDGNFQPRKVEHIYEPDIQTYDLFTFNLGIKSLLVNFKPTGSGSIEIPVNADMKTGYLLAFEHYFNKDKKAKQARVHFKYKRYSGYFEE